MMAENSSTGSTFGEPVFALERAIDMGDDSLADQCEARLLGQDTVVAETAGILTVQEVFFHLGDSKGTVG